jgi:hypothetical protein
MKARKALPLLYTLNAALLVAHEIDSAFWREWEMFGVGGGSGGFVLAHVPLVAGVLWGFERLVTGARAGVWMSLALALAGLAAGVIHSVFLLAGRTEFRDPVSLGVLLAIVLVSAAQAALAAGVLRARTTSRF